MATALVTGRIRPEHLITGYSRFYQTLHGHEARIRHMGGQWYQVNGEIVHHRTLLEEIERLRVMARRKTQPKKGIITRLVERIRLM